MSDNHEKATPQWGSKLGFLLAASGSAVGLGNVWRFPYLVVKDGGGVFVIVYLIAIVILGIPALMNELVIGRRSRSDQIGAFGALKKPNYKWVGYWTLVGQYAILAFYPVIAGWTLYYMFAEITGMFSGLSTPVQFSNVFTQFTHGAFWPVFWAVIFTLLTNLIVFFGIQKGIEQFSKIFMPVLIVSLVILIIWTLTLPNAFAGVAYYLDPNWSKLTFQSLIDAIGQAAFTLSVGYGIMLTYGAFVSKGTGIVSSSILIASMDTLVALLAGLIVIPAVFIFGFALKGGAGLTFITLPAVFNGIPFGHLFGFIFFFLLFIAAITSSISFSEGVVFTFVNYWKMGRNKALIIVIISTLILNFLTAYSMGPWGWLQLGHKSLFDVLNFVTGTILFPLGLLFYAVFVGWIAWPINDEVSTSSWFRLFWKWSIRFVIPIAVILIYVGYLFD